MQFRQFVGLLIILWVGACTTVTTRPLSADNCTTIRLWSNGWHTNLALPAEIFDQDHAIRLLFPEARYFLIGWGERDFYMVRNPSVWKGFKAIIPPSPTVIQVLAADEPVENTLWPASELAEFAVSETGARQMAEGIANALSLDEDKMPVIVEKGRLANAGYFLAARGNFHLLNMCNHWTARRLQEAGVPVRQSIAFTAPGLIRAVRRKTAASCPVGATTQTTLVRFP